MMNTKYKTIEDMIIKLQHLEGKTQSNFYEKIIDCYDQMNYMRVILLILEKILLLKVLRA